MRALIACSGALRKVAARALNRAQLCAAAPLICHDLRLRGLQWFAREHVRDTGATPGCELMLHDAILARMETDDGDAAAGFDARDRVFEALRKTVELAVDGHAEREESTRRGVDARAPSADGARLSG